jgi:uncharacterized oxidoreductase
MRDCRPVDPSQPVVVAGEPERAARAERAATGIPIDDGTWASVQKAAEIVGVDLPGALRRR